MDLKISKKYSNDEISVVWKPGVCIHSAICFHSLPQVFNPGLRPWITMSGADTERIIQQVNNCPSGALSFFRNADEPEENVPEQPATKIEAVKNGPLMVHGNVAVTDAHGVETQRNKVTAFCRCGHSNNKPFCDGSHRGAGFKDGE